MSRHVTFTLIATLLFTAFELSSSEDSASRPYHPPLPIVSQGAEGGVWHTDHNFESILTLTNPLKVAPLTYMPILYMADGTEYVLSPVTVAPEGTATVNINRSLQDAPREIRAHASEYGTVGVRFQWAWTALMASVQSTDEVRRLSYVTHLQVDQNVTHDSSATKSIHVLEAVWWKHEPQVTGFLTLINTSLVTIAS